MVDNLVEAVARALWDGPEDEYTFDDSKARCDGNGDAAYHYAMVQAQAAIAVVEKFQSADIDRLRAENQRLRAALVRDDTVIASLQGGAQ